MKGMLWGIALLALAGRAEAQWEPSFSGYVLTLPAYLRLPESGGTADSAGLSRNQMMDVTRLRLKPSLTLPWDGLVELEYEMAGIVQSAGQPVTVERKEIGRQVVDLRWTIAESERYSLIHFIDRLVYRQRFEAGELVLGRQRISWGTGRIWNPTDLFNPINPANFAKFEKDGADAVAAKLNLAPLSDLQIVWNPARDASSNYGGRFRTHAGEYDVSLLTGYFDGAVVAGGDVAGNLGRMGVRAEVLASGIGADAPERYVKAIAGLDHQLTPELYALVEYQFNGQGVSDAAAYDLEALLRGEILNVARHYLALSATYLVHPLVTVALTGMVNADDGSQFYAGTASYSATDDLVLALGLQLFAASPGDEFWYYPGTTYAKIEYYF
jgi:hypothetical protein